MAGTVLTGLIFNDEKEKKESEVMCMGNIRQYNLNGVMIIGVDNGYGNTKSVHRTFATGVIKSNEKPAFSKDVLEYDGVYYIIGEGHKEFVAEKVVDEEFYIMTLAAVATELMERKVYGGKVHLAVGLPLKWVKEQRESFRNYLLKNRFVEYTYKGEKFSIELVGCTVMPQCYAAVAEKLKDFMGLIMLADVGNGTINLMQLNNGRAAESKSWTENFGMHHCFKLIQDTVCDKTATKLPEEIIENFLRGGRLDVSNSYLALMESAAKEYVKGVFRILREHGYVEDVMKLHFIGGGARIIKEYGEYDEARTSFDLDIRVTVKGYEYYCYMMLRRQNGR